MSKLAEKLGSKNGWTYQAETINCGDEDCRSCPHGPYVYRYRKRGGRTVSEYVPKSELPGGIRENFEDVKG